VGMSSAENNYMITPMLLNPTSISFFHKKNTGNHHFTVMYQVETTFPADGPNLTGSWTLLLDLASAIGWNTTATTIPLTGLTNIYIRFMPTPPPPTPLKFFYLDDITVYEGTVPVELSSFTAVLTQELFVNLNWTTQSETQSSGYNVFKNDSNELYDATRVNLSLIPATNTSEETNYVYTDTEVEPGTWYYWLQSNDLDGTSKYFGPISVIINNGGTPEVVPVSFALNQLGPNPFNPANTQLTGSFGLSKAENVSMVVYNIRGQKVRTLINGMKNVGFHTLTWDGRDDNGSLCRSGMYYLVMLTDDFSTTKKIALIK